MKVKTLMQNKQNTPHPPPTAHRVLFYTFLQYLKHIYSQKIIIFGRWQFNVINVK